ncbi:MAG: hypothetical protein RBG13Loki_4256 [Promethearchaeota archaeon CR_4]|nr:MAG: hypothetical protein RBG13Loki_4256 [Candidatus Lokiarchaeota archaeon CR_4]
MFFIYALYAPYIPLIYNLSVRKYALIYALYIPITYHSYVYPYYISLRVCSLAPPGRRFLCTTENPARVAEKKRREQKRLVRLVNLYSGREIKSLIPV